ncbi:hypothetical protein TNCV_1413181 [Trichonephila clavipes]|nr:hypothetical protein TNCV_1413181 [Trichonephila clavipes]
MPLCPKLVPRSWSSARDTYWTTLPTQQASCDFPLLLVPMHVTQRNIPVPMVRRRDIRLMPCEFIDDTSTDYSKLEICSWWIPAPGQLNAPVTPMGQSVAAIRPVSTLPASAGYRLSNEPVVNS